MSTATIGATLIGHYQPGSDEWLEARRRRVGGSEAAVCLELSPFESLFSLWHRKAGLIDPIEQTPLLEWGNRLETAVLGKWLDEHPDYQTVHLNATFLSGTHPFMIANPDAVVTNGTDTELVEVKTSPFGDVWGPSGSTEYPVYYRAQVLHYLHVLGLRKARLIVLISGYDYREYVIEWDADAKSDIELIIDAEQRFIDSLPGGSAEQRPDIDEHNQTYQVLRELHPHINAGEEVEIDPEVADGYVDACQQVKDAEAVKRKAASTVLDLMGDAQYAVCDGQRIASRQARGEDGTPYLVAARTSSKSRKETKAA